jgi:hypothetical protein
MLPQYEHIASRWMKPLMFRELLFMFWLLIMGAKPRLLAPPGLLGLAWLGALVAFPWQVTSWIVGNSSRTSRDSVIWFHSDAIIDRRPNPLLAAKVSLGRLNRDMSQKELDLLQFAS